MSTNDQDRARAAAPTRRELDMAMAIRRIVSKARRHCEDDSPVLSLANEAWSMLLRLGLQGSPMRDAAPQAAVGVSDAQIEAIALARYKVVPAHGSMFWSHAVVAGDGTQHLYTGREVECQNMAAKFTGAFLDGAFLALSPATKPEAPADPTWTALHHAWVKVGADAAGLDWGAFTHAVHYAPAEAPANEGGTAIDISQWQKARFGVFLESGQFEELPDSDPCGEDHPQGHTARWVGGRHDMELLRAALAAPAQGDAKVLADAELLDWLDDTNKRFKMGWKVGLAPAGNVSITSIIQLGGELTPIRDALRDARQSKGDGNAND